MNRCFIGKKIVLCTCVLTGVIVLSGCGNTNDEERELAVFSSSVADFKDYILETDEKINELDVSSKESASELLEILDGMNDEFAGFADYTDRVKSQIPDQYESIPGLAKTAIDELSQAVVCYHTAYESETFGKNYADAAYTHYENSMDAVSCIGYILAGEAIPDDIQITVYDITDDEHIIDKWLSGDKDDETSENETASDGISEAVN